MKAHGEHHWRAELTAAKVRRIRRRYAKGKDSMRELGRLYGVDHSLIWQIVNRVIWRSVR
jgi:hypothetical protein